MLITEKFRCTNRGHGIIMKFSGRFGISTKEGGPASPSIQTFYPQAVRFWNKESKKAVVLRFNYFFSSEISNSLSIAGFPAFLLAFIDWPTRNIRADSLPFL